MSRTVVTIGSTDRGALTASDTAKLLADVRGAFEACDMDGDGHIDPEEMELLLSHKVRCFWAYVTRRGKMPTCPPAAHSTHTATHTAHTQQHIAQITQHADTHPPTLPPTPPHIHTPFHTPVGGERVPPVAAASCESP